jgi:hypothetical protein
MITILTRGFGQDSKLITRGFGLSVLILCVRKVMRFVTSISKVIKEETDLQ